MATPRIIFVNRFFHPDLSATAQILTDLAIDLAGRGWDIHVVASRSLYADPAVKLEARDDVQGVKVSRIWTSRFGRKHLAGRLIDYLSFYPSMAVALLRLARRGDVVVVKTDPPLASVVAAVATRIKGARLVNWLQDLYPEVAAELGMGALKGGLGRGLRRIRNASLTRAEHNAVIGELMGERLEAEGVARDRITVINNWSDDEEVTPLAHAENPVRADWGFCDADFVVGYSGNLGRAHEAETLVGAAQRLAADAPQVKFLFVGGGRHSDALKRRAEELGLSNFAFQPYQPRERLRQSLAAADVHWLSLRPELEGLIVPSKFYGIAAAGRPAIVVASRTGELGRLVQAHDAGMAVEPGDSEGLARAIAALAADRAACRAMGDRARKALDQHFTKRASLDRWDALLASITKA